MKKMTKLNSFLNVIDRLIILHPLLERISDGKFFTLIFSWLMRILACVTLIVFLWGSFKLWSNLSGATGQIFIGALVAEVFMAAIVYAVFNILWIRAYDVQKLPLAKDYSVTPIVTILIKTSGEIMATLVIFYGLAISITLWIAGPGIMRMIPFSIPLPGLSGGGAGAMVYGIIAGFLILAVSYFIAETFGALVDIARNTKKGK